MQNLQDDADRRLRALVREYNELQKRRFTIVNLDRPIQRGWRRLHVPTESARNRPDISVLENILEVIGTEVVHHSRDFRQKRGRSRKIVEIEQPLRSIRAHEWSRCNLPTAWHRYFRYELVFERNNHWQPHWVFTQPSLFELKIERNWLWYFREIDPVVESRLSEIEHWMQSNNGWIRYNWLEGHYRWRTPSHRRKLLALAHRQEIDRALAIFPEVDPAPLAQRTRISSWRYSFLRFHADPQFRGSETEATSFVNDRSPVRIRSARLPRR
jgi:hypothetical protein